MSNENKTTGAFPRVAITLILIFSGIWWGIPIASRKITGLDLPLPVPGTLFVFYFVLIMIGTFVLITSDEGMTESFLSPIKGLLTDKYGSTARIVVMILVPVALGWFVFAQVKPSDAEPTVLRIQHPSSNFPKRYESMVNPRANPTDAEVDTFIEQVKNDSVDFLPQVHQVRHKFTNIDFIPYPDVQDFLKKVKAGGTVDKALAKEVLLKKRLFEGRQMFEINCRPCHGDSTAGDGPMASGFEPLKPINFTDNGTLEVLVEGYAFWRVENGGLGLPIESTPWNSAMPVWKLDLSEKERWTILMGEYFLSEKTARIPEKVEGAGE